MPILAITLPPRTTQVRTLVRSSTGPKELWLGGWGGVFAKKTDCFTPHLPPLPHKVQLHRSLRTSVGWGRAVRRHPLPTPPWNSFRLTRTIRPMCAPHDACAQHNKRGARYNILLWEHQCTMLVLLVLRPDAKSCTSPQQSRRHISVMGLLSSSISSLIPGSLRCRR